MAISIIPGFRSLPLPVIQLSLSVVLRCGQSFRWKSFAVKPEDSSSPHDFPSHEYRLCLRDRIVCLRQNSTHLFYRSAFPQPLDSREEAKREIETLAWIQDYFQLDVDLSALYVHWAKSDPVFRGLKDRFQGIRILKQDPFECLLSFICSSNNNIARITKMVNSLCTEYSPPLLSLAPPGGIDSQAENSVEAYHPFPTPSTLASPEVSARLRALGFGYRAEFIQRTAKMLVDTHGALVAPGGILEPSEMWLQTLRLRDTVDVREELLKFVGVGRKVADCVLLMSLNKNEVVPVDTHVHKIAIKHYQLAGSLKSKTNMTPKLYEEVSNKFISIWGEYAGWAQSILFTSDLRNFSLHESLLPLSEPILPPSSPNRSRPLKGSSKRSRSPDSNALENTRTNEASAATSSLETILEDGTKRRRRSTRLSCKT